MLPLLDLRSRTLYEQGHFEGSSSFPWEALPQRLNELPCRPARLRLFGNAIQIEAATAYLTEKGYEVVEVLVENSLSENALKKHPGLVKKGAESVVLWQPSPLVVEFLALLSEQSFELPERGLDIGCGGGRDTVYLAQQGVCMQGIEHHEKVIERARQLAVASQVKVGWLRCDVMQSGCLPEQKQDLIMCIRFLNRDLLPWIKEHISAGGWLVYQTFSEGCEAYGSPKSSKFILKKGELSRFFSDFEIFVDRIDSLNDGRPVASFIARKGKNHEKNDG